MFELIAKIINFIFSTFSVWAGTPNFKKTFKNSKNGKNKKEQTKESDYNGKS
ncbi:MULTISPECIES: hypothetical protein [unclassified Mammaliicoccus]|uniref:hypothetical protein n=1 Tax=Mammaliicoccus TaxID=2803850 RepID=UPI001EFA50A2|nr:MULTISPECIES: hypothetical protein [unclassified Mammaliicoccus]